MIRTASLTTSERNEIVASWLLTKSLPADKSKNCRNQFLKWLEEKEIEEIRKGTMNEKYWQEWNKYFQKVYG